MAETPLTGSASPVPLRRTYHGCSSIKDYELSRKLGEGTFGEVYMAHHKRSREIVALKKIIMHNEKDGCPITALREIKLLKLLSHVNIIRLEEMAIERTPEKKRAILYMVTPYMEHDLSGLLDNPDIHVTEPQRKCYMQQLLRGLMYLHNSHILHRDMKAANLLISNGGILKIADFGLARHYSGPVPQPGNGGGDGINAYTGLVVTRWYRPPELLLNLRHYTTSIDMWGAGCVFGEMYKRKPILSGQSDLHQAQIIFELVGSPNEQTMPGWESLPGADSVKSMEKSPGNMDRKFDELRPDALSLLKDLLKLDWRTRINAVDALEHPYFTSPPLPARPEDIPKYKDSHELDRRNNRPAKQLPPAPEGGDVGGGANGDWAGAGPGSRAWEERPYHGRDHRQQHHGGHRDHHASSRVPQAAGGQGSRRPPAWQGNGDANNGSSRSSLPPPPGETARHPLPMNPIRVGGGGNMKDTYIPSYKDGERPRDRSRDKGSGRRDDRDRGKDRDRDDRRGDRRDDHRRDRRRDDREYRDLDRPDERYRERDRERDRDHRRTRSRSPDRERSRHNDSYRDR